MRLFLIPLAAAASAIAVAAPASGQWGPPRANQYPVPYTHGGVAQGGFVHGQNVQARLQTLRQQIQDLGRRQMLSAGQARNLDRQVSNIERRLARRSGFGRGMGQDQALERRIARIEQRLQRMAMNRHYGPRRGYGYRR